MHFNEIKNNFKKCTLSDILLPFQKIRPKERFSQLSKKSSLLHYFFRFSETSGKSSRKHLRFMSFILEPMFSVN